MGMYCVCNAFAVFCEKVCFLAASCAIRGMTVDPVKYLCFCVIVYLCFLVLLYLCICVFLCFLPASCAIKGMTVDPVKSSIDRRLVRAGKLPIAIKTEKNIKQNTKRKKKMHSGITSTKKGRTTRGNKERKKGRGRKSFLTYEGMHNGMM